MPDVGRAVHKAYSVFRWDTYYYIEFGAAATLGTVTDPAKIATVARASGGTFTITLKDKWVRICPMPQLLDAAAAADRARVKSVVESTGVITIETVVGGAVADPATEKRLMVGLILGRVTAI